MESTTKSKSSGLHNTLTRRDLLKGATVLSAAASMPQAFGQSPTGAPLGTVWLYIGTYTSSGNHGQGIYLCSLNLYTGELSVLRLVAPALSATGTTQSTANP